MPSIGQASLPIKDNLIQNGNYKTQAQQRDLLSRKGRIMQKTGQSVEKSNEDYNSG